MLKIRQIQEKEYPKTIDFANRCFNLNFKELQPKLYKNPKTYKNNYICEKDEKIVGLVSIYSFEYLKISFVGIGTVCVDPDYREQGIMSLMFKYLENNVLKQYDIAFLLGDRQRYEHYGFYRTGQRLIYRFKKKANWKTTYTFTQVLTADNELSKYYNGKVSREKNDFFNILSSDNNRVFYISINDEILGYLVYNQSHRRILEMSIMSEPCRVVYDFIEYAELKSIEYATSIDDFTFDDECSGYYISQMLNIKIINYYQVLSKAIASHEHIENGKIKISIEQIGTFDICIENGNVTINYDEYIENPISEKRITRLLFEKLPEEKYHSIPNVELFKKMLFIVLPSTMVDIDNI